jgi:hypothetical protein
MKIYFIAGILWELLRFSALLYYSRIQGNDSIVLWIASQQLVIFYFYIFLCYNKDKYCQYMKGIIAGKILGIVSGIIYFTEILLKSFFKPSIFFILNVLFIDIIITILMFFIARKYFGTRE